MSNLIERCWNAYQTGQGSADHTAKEVFTEVVGTALEQKDAEIERLRYLHKRNLADVRSWGEKQGHHCEWRVRAEGMAERSKAALNEERK